MNMNFRARLAAEFSSGFKPLPFTPILSLVIKLIDKYGHWNSEKLIQTLPVDLDQGMCSGREQETESWFSKSLEEVSLWDPFSHPSFSSVPILKTWSFLWLAKIFSFCTRPPLANGQERVFHDILCPKFTKESLVGFCLATPLWLCCTSQVMRMHKIKDDFGYSHIFPLFSCSSCGSSLLACLHSAPWLEPQPCIHDKCRYLYSSIYINYRIQHILLESYDYMSSYRALEEGRDKFFRLERRYRCKWKENIPVNTWIHSYVLLMDPCKSRYPGTPPSPSDTDRTRHRPEGWMGTPGFHRLKCFPWICKFLALFPWIRALQSQLWCRVSSGWCNTLGETWKPSSPRLPALLCPLEAKLTLSPRAGSADSPFPWLDSGEGAQTPGRVLSVVVHECCISCSCYSSRKKTPLLCHEEHIWARPLKKSLAPTHIF